MGDAADGTVLNNRRNVVVTEIDFIAEEGGPDLTSTLTCMDQRVRPAIRQSIDWPDKPVCPQRDPMGREGMRNTLWWAPNPNHIIIVKSARREKWRVGGSISISDL